MSILREICRELLPRTLNYVLPRNLSWNYLGTFFISLSISSASVDTEISDSINTIYFWNFRSHGKRTISVGTCETNASKMKRYIFQLLLFCSHSIISLSTRFILDEAWTSGKFLILKVSCFFNLSRKRKSYIDFERQNMSLFFSLMSNFYMADWILFKFSKRKKKREREKHPYFGSEASHGKFHPERIIFHKYTSSKWQCGYNRICPWTSIDNLLL